MQGDKVEEGTRGRWSIAIAVLLALFLIFAMNVVCFLAQMFEMVIKVRAPLYLRPHLYPLEAEK